MQKNRSKKNGFDSQCIDPCLDCTGNLAGAEAPSTYVDMAGSTAHESLYAADVRLPSSVGTSVGVGNLDTKGNALAANIALCHFPAPPYLKGIE